MLWMKLRDLLKLKHAPNQRNMDERNNYMPDLKKSIVYHGWLEDSEIMICDGVVSAGLLRRQALMELLDEGKITSDFMVGVDIRRTMLVQRLIPVMSLHE